MLPLALDIENSAEMLNIAPEGLRQAIDKKEITATKIGDECRISIFVLSELLSVTPDELLEYLEDFHLAEKIEEVDADESYSPEEGRRIYEQYLNEEE
jgi:predicted Co/Zn/Cd cation transporter (cation efflux family)